MLDLAMSMQLVSCIEYQFEINTQNPLLIEQIGVYNKPYTYANV